MKKKTFCPCREGTEPQGFLETPRHRRSRPLTLAAILLLTRMMEVHFAATESVSTFKAAALPGRHELTLKTTCVSSIDPGPRILGPLD